MRAISVSQAKDVDLRANRELGMSTLVMMENAGIRITDCIMKILGNKKKNVAVFCGKGNNAGDGLVVSRQLICQAVNVDTFLLAPVNSLSGVAKKNLDILRKLTHKIRQIRNEHDLEKINLSSYMLLIDAIFGIGIKGKVEGIFRAAIRRLNSSKKTIISVDVPSGLDANKGLALGAAVKADYTISLIAPKKGLLTHQGRKFSGRIITRHIGFPWPRL